MTDKGFIVHVLLLFESKRYPLSNNMCSDHWILIYLVTFISFFVQHDRTVHGKYESIRQVHYQLYTNTHTLIWRDWSNYENLNYHSQPQDQYSNLELPTYEAVALSIIL